MRNASWMSIMHGWRFKRRNLTCSREREKERVKSLTRFKNQAWINQDDRTAEICYKTKVHQILNIGPFALCTIEPIVKYSVNCVFSKVNSHIPTYRIPHNTTCITTTAHNNKRSLTSCSTACMSESFAQKIVLIANLWVGREERWDQQ